MKQLRVPCCFANDFHRTAANATASGWQALTFRVELVMSRAGGHLKLNLNSKARGQSVRFVGVTLLAIMAVSVSCSSADDEYGPSNSGASGSEDSDSGAAGSGASGSGASGSEGSDSGAAGSGTSGSGGSGNNAGGQAGAGNGGSGFEECVATTTEAQGVGLDMYVTLDHTNSMEDDCPLDLTNTPAPDSSKWCFATHALAQYFVSDNARGHRAALQFMSLEDSVCTGGASNGAAYPAVDLTELPVDPTNALVTALDTDSPVGGLGTQIESALHGIATFTGNNVTAGRTMIGILITDGDPNGCDEDIDNLAAIASSHLAATGIRTFIIGMTGATLANLETMAEAGGAPEHGPDFCGPGVAACHYWSVGDGDPVAFVDALEQIQAVAVLPCEYVIPSPRSGEQIDYDMVNVTFTDAGGSRSTIGRANGPDRCDPQTGGWFYDDPAAPSTIRLCEATCNTVNAATGGANLHIVYGCERTVTIE